MSSLFSNYRLVFHRNISHSKQILHGLITMLVIFEKVLEVIKFTRSPSLFGKKGFSLVGVGHVSITFEEFSLLFMEYLMFQLNHRL